MNITELENKYGALPENLDRKKVEALLRKRENIYPLVNNLFESVSNWLKSEDVLYVEQPIKFTLLNGETKYLTGFRADNVIVVLVDDYSIFHKRVVAKDTASKIHLELIKQGLRVVWCKKFEWENLNKRAVMQSLILHVLGKTKIRYFARKTVCEIVPNRELRTFFNESSFYAYRNADEEAVVLKDKNTGEIVQAMSFGHPYYGKNKYGDRSVECIRSAGKRNSVVVGGMTKLMKFYVEKFGDTFDKIIYYVDDAHHQSDSMEALGFEFSHFAGGAVHNVWQYTGAMMMRTPAQHQGIMYMQKVGEILGIPDVGNSIYTYDKKV